MTGGTGYPGDCDDLLHCTASSLQISSLKSSRHMTTSAISFRIPKYKTRVFGALLPACPPAGIHCF